MGEKDKYSKDSAVYRRGYSKLFNELISDKNLKDFDAIKGTFYTTSDVHELSAAYAALKELKIMLISKLGSLSQARFTWCQFIGRVDEESRADEQDSFDRYMGEKSESGLVKDSVELEVHFNSLIGEIQGALRAHEERLIELTVEKRKAELYDYMI